MTPDERNGRMIAMALEGRSNREIADALGERMGLVQRVVREARKGDPALRDSLGERTGRPASPDIARRNARIVELAQSGLSGPAIASACGVTRVLVNQILYQARTADRSLPGGRPPASPPRPRQVVPEDTRSLTARLLGDPLPGRSALDRERNVPAGGSSA